MKNYDTFYYVTILLDNETIKISTKKDYSDLENIIIEDFIPENTIYIDGLPCIDYSSFSKIKTYKAEVLKYIIRMIQNENITITNLPEEYSKAILSNTLSSYHIESITLTSGEIDNLGDEYKKIKNKEKQTKEDIKRLNEIKTIIIKRYTRYIKHVINYYSRIPADTEILEDICYGKILTALDNYAKKEKNVTLSYLIRRLLFNTINAYFFSKKIENNKLYGSLILKSINYFLKNNFLTFKEVYDDISIQEELLDYIKNQMEIRNYKFDKERIQMILNQLFEQSLNDYEVINADYIEITKFEEFYELKKFIDELPLKEKNIVYMYFYQGYTVEEIATEMSCAKQRISQIINGKIFHKILNIPSSISLPSTLRPQKGLTEKMQYIMNKSARTRRLYETYNIYEGKGKTLILEPKKED